MKNKEKNFVSAVVYVHNSSDRILTFLEMLINVLENSFEYSEIICVNDFSEDSSLSLIRQVSGKTVSVSVSILNMSYFHGLELAMNAGVELAIGDFVFEFDNTYTDFDESEIMKVYRKALDGYDIVNASPDRKEKLSSRIFYHVFRQYAAVSCQMNTESFRILSRRVINRISSMNNAIIYRKILYANCGLKTASIRYTPKPLQTSAPRTDKAERAYRIELAIDSLLLFTEVGYRFSMAMTIFMMLATIFMVIYSIAIYVTIHPVEGWTTTILFLSAAFFGLFGIMTIIIKYLQLMLNLEFKKKQYSFESIEKL